TRWIGEPANREPEKCRGLGWFDLRELPANIIEYPAAGIDAYRRGLRGMSLLGWGGPRPAPGGA
ncbi:hypothetical protein LH612_31940, partial [Klebsiella pneumoniae]|nr:hypothetical protein [Klebsiella pneumoniae]